MKDENLLDPEDKRVPILVETFGLGPHGAPVITLSKDGDKKYHTWIWVLATVIVGISVASFFYNGITKVVAYVEGKTKTPYTLLASNEITDPNQNNVDNALYDASSTVMKAGQTEGSNDADTPQATSTPGIDGQYYFLTDNYTLPRTSGLAYLVGDIDTGEVIISKNADMVFPIASVSKLTTALVEKDVLDQHKLITVSKNAASAEYGTLGGLQSGEKILPTDLIYPLLMESSNNAAEVFAQGYSEGEGAFIKLMNDKVKSLGMTSTSYDDPSGLSQNNVSDVTDLFTLAKYVTKSHPELWDVTRTRGYSIITHSWLNNNALSRRSNFIGGKNGFTYEAFNTTVTIFNVQVGKSSRRIAVIVLKSNNRDGDVDLLLRFVANNVGFLPAGENLDGSPTK